MRTQIGTTLMWVGWLSVFCGFCMFGVMAYIAHVESIVSDRFFFWEGVSIPCNFGGLLLVKIGAEFKWGCLSDE